MTSEREQGKGRRLFYAAAVGSVCATALAAIMFRLSGFSVSALVNLQNTVMEKALVDTAGLNTIGSVAAVVGYVSTAIAGFALIAAAYAFLSAYGFFEEDRKGAAVIGGISAVALVAIMGITLATVVMAAGLAVTSILVVPLSHTYGNELKKWIRFRVGSNAVGRALFVLNLLIALAVFLTVLSALPAYEASFTADFRESISTAVKGSLPAGLDTAALDTVINKQIDAVLASPLVETYIRWLPVVSGVGVWVLLEFLRMFLPYLAGACTAVFIRLFHRWSG